MKTKIKIIFKDNTECVFNANTHTIDDDNYDYDFYRLGLIDEKGNYKFVALVSIPYIKFEMQGLKNYQDSCELLDIEGTLGCLS